MLTRRVFAASSAALLAAPLASRSALALGPAPKLGEDGLYHFDWYLESFLDIAEDIAAASANGKRLAIMWGLKGCPACRTMHEVQLRDEATVAYIRSHFEILHLNHIGARDVIRPGGQKMAEKAYGEAEGIRFTPSIQFMPEKTSGASTREVARMPGLLEQKPFLAMFRYVKEKGYEATPFPEWLKKQGV
ncbi:MAG: SoxW family protein [Bosea sp. (in: a-proteobacteria)]